MVDQEVADAAPAAAALDEPAVLSETTNGKRSPRGSIALLCIGFVVALGLVRLLASLGRPYTSGGDVGYLELGVRDAVHFRTALGVYSRFGWYHPGPALLYLDAPLYWLSSERSRSLFLSAWLINGLSAFGTVWILRRRASEIVARVAACWLFVYFCAAQFADLHNPWNPAVLALPLMLLIAAAAGATDGSAWCLVGAFVVGSYLVQADIGSLPLTAVVLLLGTFAFFWRVRHMEGRERPRWRAPLIVGVLVCSIVWVGPFGQEVTNHDGNLTKIARFEVHTPTIIKPHSHSLREALEVVSDAATIVPFGRAKDIHGHAGRAAAAGFFALLGLGAAWGLRRRSRVLTALALATPIGFAVAVMGAMRVPGPLLLYLFFWTESLPLPALISATALALIWISERNARAEQVVRVFTIAAVVIVTIVATVAIDRGGTTSAGDTPAARTVAAAIERTVPKQQTFLVHVQDDSYFRGALVLLLDKDGYRFRLDHVSNLYAGSVNGPVNGPTFDVRPTKERPADGSAGSLLVSENGVDLSVKAAS